ncbi:hypothetical protein DL766_009695 [Monosporascus sp. MC13-8B]|uniref:Uncharacterized protein n=1 Tax=Monosporascus cannonballus TaxID=155416 RepID=A0ABY0GY23_9PEZI|nr:hypothetical protein DL762_009420 [Monosporascus cannonballus]RYO84070.1 hypothetical protein DL763_007606 [Monosporascus cannonballus]RYP14413.1 hypothetical protein DL766_009695 [Monosporascus sp. MC13-8B]
MLSEKAQRLGEQPHALSSGSQSSPDAYGGDNEGPAPPYTPFPTFPMPPRRTGSAISQTHGAEAPSISTRLEIPQPLTHAHTRDTASPATPMSERSIRSFQTADDHERGSLRLTLTRSTTYNQIKPFFSRGSEPFDNSPQPGVSPRKSKVIAVTVLTLTLLVVLGIIFGLVKWYT